MKPKNIFILLLIVIPFISCKKQKSGENTSILNKKLLEISVQESLLSNENNHSSDYSNLIDSIEVIKLETSANSLIGRIRKIEYLNNKIYILTDSQVLLIFDKNGHFLKKLDKKGKGMGEYIEIKDFFIDNDNSIKVLSYNTIITYDSNLKYVDSKKIKANHNGKEIVPLKFLPNGNFNFLFVGSFGIRDIVSGEDKALYCIDSNMKITNEYFPVTSIYTSGHNNFYKSNKTTYFTDTFGNDTIYQIHDNYLIPKMFVNFLEKKTTTKDMMKNRDIFYNTFCDNRLCGNLMNIYENNDYLCFLFAAGRYAKQGVYNKKNKELKILNVANNFPFPKIITEGVIDDHFFTTIDPFLLLKNPANINYSDFLKKFTLTDIKDTDNPIIIKFKFIF